MCQQVRNCMINLELEARKQASKESQIYHLRMKENAAFSS